MMVSKSHRFSWITALGLAATGCYAGGANGGSGDADDADSADGGSDGAGTAGDAGDMAGDESDGGGDPGPGGGIPDPPPTCLPGAVGCECLDGACEGLSTCEDNVCIPGPPIPEVDGDGIAIAGLAIALSGDIDDDENLAGYEQLQWTQVEGPEATIAYEYGTDAVAYLPADAPDDMQIVFRLSAVLGEVATSADYTVTILGADATGPMDEAKEVIALGGATFAPRGNNDYWLGTPLGVFARIDDNAIMAEYDLASPIADIVPYTGGLVLIAQPELQVITEFNSNNNVATPFLSTLSGGAPLGGVSVLAVDGEDNVYIGTTEGTILFFDSPDGAEPATTTLMETLTVTPTALALGDVVVAPDIDEGDEGNVLYIGGADGDIWQIGLSAPEDGSDLEIGTASLYVSVPGTGAVTGLAVDGVGNMWVGKSSGMYLVRRAAEENPTVVRTIAPTSGLAGFTGLRADDGRLEWIDGASGRVGQLVTGQ